MRARIPPGALAFLDVEFRGLAQAPFSSATVMVPKASKAPVKAAPSRKRSVPTYEAVQTIRQSLSYLFFALCLKSNCLLIHHFCRPGPSSLQRLRGQGGAQEGHLGQGREAGDSRPTSRDREAIDSRPAGQGGRKLEGMEQGEPRAVGGESRVRHSLRTMRQHSPSSHWMPPSARSHWPFSPLLRFSSWYVYCAVLIFRKRFCWLFFVHCTHIRMLCTTVLSPHRAST